MFCVWKIYRVPIAQAIDAHCEMMRVKTKRGNRTQNPFFPSGTHRPVELFSQDSFGKNITEREISLVEEHVEEFWASGRGPTADEQDADPTPGSCDDPLKTAALRAERDRQMRELGISEHNLQLRYRALRLITRELLELGDDDDDGDGDDDGD